MKNKIGFQKYKYYLNDDFIKILIGLIIIMLLFSVFNSILFIPDKEINYSFVDLSFMMFNSNYFPYLAFIFMPLVITINIYKIYEKFYSYLIRQGKMENNLAFLIKETVKIVSIIYIIIISFIILINLFISSFTFIDHFYYPINSIIYLIYHVIKIYLLNILIININLFLFNLIDTKIVFIFYVILFAISDYVMISNISEISTLEQMPIFIGKYLFRYNYSNFVIELSCFIVYFFIGTVLLKLLKYLNFKIGNRRHI